MKRTSKLYAARPSEFHYEARDCGVRAFAIAANIPYAEAHRLLKNAGRISKRGTYDPTVNRAAPHARMAPLYLSPGANSAEVFDGFPKQNRPTLAQFVRTFNKGRWMVRVHTHFVAVVDGVVHDWPAADGWSGPRTRVIRAWRNIA